MKRPVLLCAGLLAALCLAVVCTAADSSVPAIADERVYIAAPDSLPCESEFEDGVITSPLAPGSTLYFEIEGADRAEDLSDFYARVLFDFYGSCGEEYVGTPSIEYRMCYNSDGKRQTGYRYLLALPISDVQDNDTHKIRARVSLRRQKSGSVYFTATVRSVGTYANAVTVACEGGDNVITFDSDITAVRLEFEYANFTVETVNQAPLNVGVSFHNFTDLEWAYPSAELLCLDWQHEPIFNRVGILEIPASSGLFFYEIRTRELCDLTSSFVPSTGCFTVETRRLSSYVVSDKLLGKTERMTQPENPLTGAIL